MNSSLPQPQDLGFSGKFKSWRQGQVRAIMDIVDNRNRFLTQIQPTGSGKSLCYVTAAMLTDGRTLILTSLKGLQEQLVRDFPWIVKVMGKSSYTCPVIGQSCEWAPCNFGRFCSRKKELRGCPYYDAIRKARKARVIVTNYAFWHSNKPDRLGEFDLLVCDEAHNTVNHLIDSLSLRVTRKSVSGLGVQWLSQNDDPWEWSCSIYDGLCTELKRRVDKVKESVSGASDETFKQLYMLKQRFTILTEQDPSQWVVELLGDHITFDPLWPPEFSEDRLFRAIPSILLTSATMGSSTLSMLGVPTHESQVIEYPSYFPISRQPTYYVPTTRVDYRINNLGYGLWCNRIDQIIARRLDRKGIIHTVSYDRCKRIMNVSEHSEYFHTHKSKGVSKSIKAFRDADAPAVLCSPSVVTGWDFPYEECEYQIIGKVPFPDSRRKVDKARQAKNPDFSCCMAMQNLVQTCGRGMRYPDDQCENLIIDDHFAWFVRKYKKYAPQWWLDTVSMVKTIPEPPQKLGGR